MDWERQKKEFLQINLRCCTDFILDKRTLLEEVWSIILGYLMPIDLFNVSVCYKLHYVLTHKIKWFEKKLSILKNFRVIKICMTNIVIYLYFLLTSYNQKLRNFLVEDIRTFLRKNLALDLTFDILPFRIYNHCFSCDRGSYLNNRCNLCSKFFIRDKKYQFFR